MAAQMNKEEDMEYAMMKKKKKEGGGDGEEEENDMTAKDYYFDSYSHFGIHEEMLKDTVRTRSYERAISRCAHLIRGKTVLDVGCGTGILSLFCARAGAKRVFGVECSAIAKTAQEVVKENGMEDIVRIVRGKVEEVELPFDEGEEPYVDVIVSEWMGYFLVYEAMLKSVAIARERWLREGGLVMPGSARLLLCGIEDGEYRKEKIDYWDNVYGFKMTCIRKLAIQEPLVDTVAAEQVCTTSSVVCRLDIGKIESEKTAEPFSAPFRLLGTRSDIVHAFVGYFDCTFAIPRVASSASGENLPHEASLVMSTSPEEEYTHWKQTVMYLEHPIHLREGDAITGTITCAGNSKNPRDLDISIEYSYESGPNNQMIQRTQAWRMR